MIEIKYDNQLHNWEKQNLVTQADRRGSYDLLKCSKCGLQGKARRLTTVEVSSRSAKKAEHCDGSYKKAKRVRVIECQARGPQFENATPGSIHEVVETPKEYKDSKMAGVWIQGVGEPIKLLSNEFVSVDD